MLNTDNKPLLSLITYNIHKGFSVGQFRFLLPQMRHALSNINPDFVFLQEVQGLHLGRARRISSWPNQPQFAYLAQDDWPFYLYAKNAVYNAGHHGNAILSKYPFQQYENINLSKQNRASRSMLYAQCQLESGQTLHLLCVHLGLFKAERAVQCQRIIKQIKELIPLDEPLLMAGDFNDWRLDLSAPLQEELGILDSFQQINGHPARTFPAIQPTLCVDRIYYRGLTVQQAQCLQGKPWRTLSDHLPLHANFNVE